MSYSIYSIDDYVRWKWGDNRAYGRVKERYTDKITKTIEGTTVTRNANQENAAYLIEQSDGSRVLKLHSELQKAG